MEAVGETHWSWKCKQSTSSDSLPSRSYDVFRVMPLCITVNF
jgi:hypothetical protein